MYPPASPPVSPSPFSPRHPLRPGPRTPWRDAPRPWPLTGCECMLWLSMFCGEAGSFRAALARSGARWLPLHPAVSTPTPAARDGRGRGGQAYHGQLMYVSMNAVLQAAVCASGVGAGGFCEGLSRRPLPLVLALALQPSCRYPGLLSSGV
jgi:hypothetical protein